MGWEHCPWCGNELEDGPREDTYWCDSGDHPEQKARVIDPDDWPPLDVTVDEDGEIVKVDRRA